MKKILYIIPRFTIGGAEMMLLQTVLELKKSGGYEIVMAAVRAGGELEKKFVDAGVKTFVASRAGFVFGPLLTWWRLSRLVREFAPQVIHSHVFSADFTARFLPRKNSKIFWISTQHNGRELYSSFRRTILKFVLRAADQVIAVSPEVRDFCASCLDVPVARLRLIINGVPIENYRCPNLPRFSSPFRLVNVGRLISQKNHALLLSALSELKKYDWILHIYGEGELRTQLEMLTRSLKISDRVVFFGNTEKIAQVFCTADLVVQTSDFEGMSLVLLEAMAAGRTIVATEAAGKGIIANGVDGILVGTGDRVALREVLVYLFENPNKAQKMAIQAAQKAHNFTFAHTIAALKHIYQNV